MNGVAALLKLELRRCASFLGVPLVELAVILLGGVIEGTWWLAHAWLPEFLVLLLPLVAAGLGADALAGEREERTWSLLRARPMSLRSIVATKAAARLLILALVLLGCALVVRAFRGTRSVWIEELDISGAQGVVLAILLCITAFASAFAAGAKLDEPLGAMAVGWIGSIVLVGLLLLPGLLAGGTLRSALATPAEWARLREASTGELEPSGEWTSASGRVRVAQLEDRVLLQLLDEESARGPRRVVLPRGTTTHGVFDVDRVRVSFLSWGSRVERLIDASGRTRPVEVTP